MQVAVTSAPEAMPLIWPSLRITAVQVVVASVVVVIDAEMTVWEPPAPIMPHLDGLVAAAEEGEAAEAALDQEGPDPPQIFLAAEPPCLGITLQ